MDHTLYQLGRHSEILIQLDCAFGITHLENYIESKFQVYLTTSRLLRRMSAASMAVVNGHIAESIAGVATIRDYNIQPQVIPVQASNFLVLSVAVSRRPRNCFSCSFPDYVDLLKISEKALLKDFLSIKVVLSDPRSNFKFNYVCFLH